MIRELSIEEFEATFVAPMRSLAANEPPPVFFNVKGYLGEVIAALELPTTVETVDIQYVFVADGELHTHILFYYGVLNHYLVLVVDNTAKSVLGHHRLDLAKIYGIET